MSWFDSMSDNWWDTFDKIKKTVSEWQGQQPKMVSPIPKSRMYPEPIPQEMADAHLKEVAENNATRPTPVQQSFQQQMPSDPNQMMLDYAPYVANQAAVNVKWPKGMPQVSPETLGLLMEYFPEDATRAAITILSESGDNPQARNDSNKDGSIDLGLGQINSDTFADYQRRMGKKMGDMGINSYQEMVDPRKNIQMMDLIQQYQGWPAWYGPRDTGFKLGR